MSVVLVGSVVEQRAIRKDGTKRKRRIQDPKGESACVGAWDNPKNRRASDEAMEDRAVTTKTIDLADIINSINKQKEEIKLPNGSKKTDYNWRGSDLPAIDAHLRGIGLGRADHVIVTNVRVGWLVLAIVHGVHPAFCSLADDKVEGGSVPIGCADPAGDGSGNGIEFKTIDKGEYVLVEYNIPGGTFDVKNLASVVPPAIPSGKGVVISGRGSNWLTVSIAMAYHGSAKWVGLFQPGVGATVAMTHSPERVLGDVIKI